MYLETPETPINAAKLRLPNIQYEGYNGYEEVAPVTNPEGAPSEAELNQHRTAMYILTQKDRAIPTLQQMTDALARPEDLPSLKEQITEAKEQHLSDLERLYALHAEEYLDDALDRYHSKDDSQFLAEGENNATALASYEKLDILYNDPRKYPSPVSRWEDEVARMRYTHFRHLHPLYAKQLKIKEEHKKQMDIEEEERKRQEAQFPLSVEDFYSKPMDVQHRAARFLLLSDIAKQEKMLDEFGWAWRQVKPLLDETEKNAKFKAEIQAKVIELEVRDPRKRI